MKVNICVLICFVFCSLATAQEKESGPELDSFFTKLHLSGQFNGNVLVAEKEQIIYHNALGYADFAIQKPNIRDSRFSLGSVSKIFTALAVLQLRDQNKLQLDDPVVDHLPEFPFRDVHIRHLLSHTSGLPGYELFESLIHAEPERVIDNRNIIPALKLWDKALYFQAGERWQYSNINYGLLALLVEKRSGLSFAEYLQRFIFSIAGMQDTYLPADTASVPDDKRVVDHEFPKWYASVPEDVQGIDKFRWRLYNLNGIYGPGNVISSTEDLLKFDHALYNNILLEASSLEEAFTPTRLNDGSIAQMNIGIGNSAYGLGWFILKDERRGRVVWHSGGVPGALSIFFRNTDRRQTVILLDNAFSTGLYQHGMNALRLLNHQAPIRVKNSLTRPFGASLVSEGIDNALCLLLQLRSDTAHYYLHEGQMNLLGYQLLYEASFARHKELALEVFRINTLLFPDNYNVYDSYGEGLWKTGKLREAVQMYHRSLEINPDNEEGKAALQKILPLLKGSG